MPKEWNKHQVQIVTYFLLWNKRNGSVAAGPALVFVHMPAWVSVGYFPVVEEMISLAVCFIVFIPLARDYR